MAERQATNVMEAANIISMIGQPKPEAAQELETPPPAEQQEPPPQEIKEPDKQVEEQAAEEEPQLEVEEPAAEEPKAEIEPEQQQQGDAQEVEIEPQHLAGLLGVEESDLGVTEDGELRLTAKVDGEVHQVTLRDLRDGYQLAKTSQQRLNKLAEDRKTLETERQQAIETLGYQQQQVAQALQAIEQEYLTNFQSVDWQRLRDEDPTEYNLKRNDYEDRKKKIDEFKSHQTKAAEQLQMQSMQQLQAVQAEGAQKLDDIFSGTEYRKAPTWNQAEKDKLSSWLISSQGYTPEQISMVSDYRFFKWARDSMLREQEQKAAKQAVKKVVKLPKITKPGAKKSAKQIRRSKLDDAKTRQRKDKGSMKATQDLISEIMRS